MPRSSRHKSSKHSSRDARDYSDSEKDSSSKDRKSKDESSTKLSKESASGENRKFDSKDKNEDYIEDYSTLKRRREKIDDDNDRWNGGDDDREGAKKSKDKLSESKSKRRGENTGAYGESDAVLKKSSGKSEAKHRESSNGKEGREGGGEREREKEKEQERFRRVKEGRTEKLFDVDDLRTMKQVSEKTEFSMRDLLRTSEINSLSDKRSKKKRDDFSDGDKNNDELKDSKVRQLSSREDVTKNGRPKEEKHKDDRYRDKYREDVDRERRHRDDKQRDERVGKDKNSRDNKENVEIRLKKHHAQDGDCAHERDHDLVRDHDLNARDNDRGSYPRDRDRDRDRYRDHDKWDRDRDQDKECDRDRNIDYDVLPIDDRNVRYKDSRGKKRSPDDYDDNADTKSRGVKTAYLDMEKVSMSSIVESDADRGKSQSCQPHADNNAGSNRRRASPNTSSLGDADEYRQPKQEDVRYKETGIEHRSSKPISSRDVTGIAGASERSFKYGSNEKHIKMDGGHMGELSIERSYRSPSSTSLERRYSNRAGFRRNLDAEESMRRSNASTGSKDLPSADDRPNRDSALEKSSMDDSTLVDSSLYNRTGQSNSALNPPPSFRSGAGSPSFMGSLEEDGRTSAGSRYKRSGDPNFGRGQGNAWQGPPNWSSPLPNGFIPFRHGPHHGAFQAMMPQFPSPLFGVRPSMDITHSGIPYHISDADRFASHMRPLGWQNTMDGSGPAHMNGWDGSNSVFRDESHLYGRPEWDQSRHSVNGRGWEGNADIWKGQNGDMNSDMPSSSLKEDFPVEEVSVSQSSHKEGNDLRFQAKAADTKTSNSPLSDDSHKTSPETTLKKTNNPPKSLHDDIDHPYYAYLSELDISTELADPELYDQFASFLKIKQIVNVKEDATMLVNLKDGARAIAKTSSFLLSSSLFPVTRDSVFQKAISIYKRQRASTGGMPFANGGIIDVILESKIEEQVPPNKEAAIPEEPVAKHNDKISDANSNSLKVETNPNIAVPEASEITPIKEAEAEVETDKPVMEPSGSEMDMILSYKPSSSEAGLGEIVCYETLETKGGSSSSITLNSEGEGDGKWGPLISPKTGTYEWESVSLSRIHHSPESTH